MELKYALGLDISSQKINGCLSVIDNEQRVKVKSSTVITNNLSGFKKLSDWINKHYKNLDVPLVINMEATGIYYEACALFLYENGYSVSVVLPNKANKYLAAIGLKSKNDSIDAKGLAQMAAEQSLKLWQPHGHFFYTLKMLTRHHQILQEQKTVAKNQLHAITHAMYKNKTVESQFVKLIQLLDKQIQDIEKSIDSHIKSDTVILDKVKNICKIKGVGLITTATILAETNGFELFENVKQLVSYAGYDVVQNQSGSHIGKTKISKQGNARIRRALFMPAFSAVRCKQKPFIELYQRTFERHKIKMKSYVAVQKKLLTTIFSLYKSNKIFDENHHQKISMEKEQVHSSQVAIKNSKKNSHTHGVAIQGKHPREKSQYASSQVLQN